METLFVRSLWETVAEHDRKGRGDRRESRHLNSFDWWIAFDIHSATTLLSEQDKPAPAIPMSGARWFVVSYGIRLSEVGFSDFVNRRSPVQSFRRLWFPTRVLGELPTDLNH